MFMDNEDVEFARAILRDHPQAIDEKLETVALFTLLILPEAERTRENAIKAIEARMSNAIDRAIVRLGST